MDTPHATLEIPEPSRASAVVGRRKVAAATPDALTMERIFGQHRRGVADEVLAREYGLTRTGLARAITAVRASRLKEARIDFMGHPSFEDPARHAEILRPMPDVAEGDEPRTSRPPEGLPPYLASLYDVPLLTREQESHLFRKMNFLRYRAATLRDALDPARARAAQLDEIERLQAEALAVKNQIIRANLRLVVSIAKKNVGQADNLFERISDGNISLIRAVEKFDFSRGNKFSTYASWAIIRNFARTIRDEHHRRDRFVTGQEIAFEAAADPREEERETETSRAQNQEVVHGILGRLDERERKILISRFGIGDSGERTLEDLGRELGITKERVRQIEARAQNKLRKIAADEQLDSLMA